MKVFQVACGSCGAELSVPLPEASVHTPCPTCETDVWVEAFPALIKGVAPGKSGERLLVDDESSCFYHPGKKAVILCDGCGRFLCALCEIDLSGQHLCPVCIETGVKKAKLKNLKKESVYYDVIAMAVAIIPMIFLWISFITAPIALYIAIRYWKTPLSVVPRRKWRFVVAIVAAGLQLVAWGMVVLILMGYLFNE
jgi:hypothetical protein